MADFLAQGIAYSFAALFVGGMLAGIGIALVIMFDKFHNNRR